MDGGGGFLLAIEAIHGFAARAKIADPQVQHRIDDITARHQFQRFSACRAYECGHIFSPASLFRMPACFIKCPDGYVLSPQWGQGGWKPIQSSRHSLQKTRLQLGEKFPSHNSRPGVRCPLVTEGSGRLQPAQVMFDKSIKRLLAPGAGSSAAPVEWARHTQDTVSVCRSPGSDCNRHVYTGCKRSRTIGRNRENG
jgi:hypothetical protein